jgi:hypothetical protein
MGGGGGKEEVWPCQLQLGFHISISCLTKAGSRDLQQKELGWLPMEGRAHFGRQANT